MSGFALRQPVWPSRLSSIGSPGLALYAAPTEVYRLRNLVPPLPQSERKPWEEVQADGSHLLDKISWIVHS